jgi:hypothetical protein
MSRVYPTRRLWVGVSRLRSCSSEPFAHYTDNHVRERILSAPSPELQQLRAMEENHLTTYGYVGKDKQVAHLPITEGMKKVIEEAKK